LADGIVPGQEVSVLARGAGGDVAFRAILRVDEAAEVEVLRQGGLLPMVLEQLRAG
jgi:aconitase A